MPKPAQRDIKLVIGGESRVDLLPPEVTARASARTTRRALAGVVIAAVMLSAGGYAAASVVAATNAQQLAAEQARTSQLLAQQSEFSEVGQVEERLETAIAAAQVAGSTEVDWKSYLDGVKTALPAGVAISGVAADSADPMEAYAQSESPLQGERIATLVFTATSGDLPQVEQWLIALEQLPGFVDAVPGSITSDEEAGYSTTITMHIDSAAYSGRFAVAAETAEVQE